MTPMIVHCLFEKMIPVSELKPHPKNRNKHPKDQIERLAKILSYQGVRAPIVVSKESGFIVKGHGTLQAIKTNEWTEAAVVYQSFSSPDVEYAFVQSDNAIASWADLDFSAINIDFPDLGPDFDLDMLGIKNFKIDKQDAPEDPGPTSLPVEPKTKRGDIYVLGNHRLICGDATMLGDVEKLMDKLIARLVEAMSHFFEDSFTEDEWQSLLSGSISNLWIAMADNSVAYVCLDWRRSHELVPHLKKHFKFSNLIVWDKVVHGLGSDYKYTHELIHVCKKGDPELDTHQGDAEYQDLWHLQRIMGHDEEHATKKPIELVERAIRHGSKQDQIVLDLFGGSGSTLVAAERLQRRCFMSELDPRYCDVIVSRWEKMVGQTAQLIKADFTSI